MSRQEADSRQFADLVEGAANRAVQKAIAEHHRAGDPVAIWRNGQIVLLYPDGSLEAAEGEVVRPRGGDGP